MMEMRDRATAYLAKEEKEFTSTVVLSKDKTIYMSNNNNAGKRNKKMPKRFDDCVRIMDNVKSLKFLSDSNSEPIAQQKVRASDLIPATNTIALSTRELAAIDSMGHVSVCIEPLDKTFQSLEPWCMVHSLFKCFCKLNATAGTRFDFARDDADLFINSRVEPSTVKDAPSLPPPLPSPPLPSPKASSKPSTNLTKNSPKVHSPVKITLKRRNTLERDEFDITQSSTSKFVEDDLVLPDCCRTRPVNVTVLLKRNRKRAHKIKAYIEKRERNYPQLRAFLINRVKRCLMTETPLQIVENPSPNNTPEPPAIPPNDRSVNDDNSQEVPPPPKIPKMMIKLNRDSLLKNQVSISRPKTPNDQNVKEINETTPPPFKGDSFNEMQATTSSSNTSSSASFMLNNDCIPQSTMLSDEDKRKQMMNVNKLNLIVTRTMQSMCNIQRAQIQKLQPPVLKSLTSVQWVDFIQMYNNDTISVWKVQLENDDLLLVATVKKAMPIIQNTMCVVNIKSAASNPLPVLAQLLKMGQTNQKTEHMAVLLFGSDTYWRILGCIHSQHEYLNAGIQAKPTPISHPRLSRKVSLLFNVLTNRRQSASKTHTLAAQMPMTSHSTVISKETPTVILPQQQPSQETVHISQSKNSNQGTDKETDQIACSSTEQLPAPLTTSSSSSSSSSSIRETKTQVTSVSKVRSTKRKSNIPLINLSTNVLISISLPVPTYDACRWFMVTIATDFSHIFVPAWRNVLTLVKIQNAIAYAKQSNKTMKFSPHNAKLDVYATPNETNKIFFGPYGKHDEMDLLLCQLYRKQFLAIGDFKRLANVPPSTSQCTTGCWLYFSKKTAPPTSNEAVTSSAVSGQTDDDCVIIDPVSEAAKLDKQNVCQKATTDQQTPINAGTFSGQMKSDGPKIINIRPHIDDGGGQQQRIDKKLTLHNMDSLPEQQITDADQSSSCNAAAHPIQLSDKSTNKTSPNNSIQVVHMELLPGGSSNISAHSDTIHNTNDFDSDDDCLVIDMDACNSPIKGSTLTSITTAATTQNSSDSQLKLLLEKPARDPGTHFFKPFDGNKKTSIKKTSQQSVNSFISTDRVENLGGQQPPSSEPSTSSGLVISAINSVANWTASIQTGTQPTFVIDRVESISHLPEPSLNYSAIDGIIDVTPIPKYVRKIMKVEPVSPTLDDSDISTNPTDPMNEPMPFLILKPNQQISGISPETRHLPPLTPLHHLAVSRNKSSTATKVSSAGSTSALKVTALPIEKLHGDVARDVPKSVSNQKLLISAVHSEVPFEIDPSLSGKMKQSFNVHPTNESIIHQQSTSHSEPQNWNKSTQQSNIPAPSMNSPSKITQRRHSVMGSQTVLAASTPPPQQSVMAAPVVRDRIKITATSQTLASKVQQRRHSIMVDAKAIKKLTETDFQWLAKTADTSKNQTEAATVSTANNLSVQLSESHTFLHPAKVKSIPRSTGSVAANGSLQMQQRRSLPSGSVTTRPSFETAKPAVRPAPEAVPLNTVQRPQMLGSRIQIRKISPLQQLPSQRPQLPESQPLPPQQYQLLNKQQPSHQLHPQLRQLPQKQQPSHEMQSKQSQLPQSQPNPPSPSQHTQLIQLPPTSVHAEVSKVQLSQLLSRRPLSTKIVSVSGGVKISSSVNSPVSSAQTLTVQNTVDDCTVSTSSLRPSTVQVSNQNKIMPRNTVTQTSMTSAMMATHKNASEMQTCVPSTSKNVDVISVGSTSITSVKPAGSTATKDTSLTNKINSGGFMVTNLIGLGKIPAIKTANGSYNIQLPTLGHVLKVADLKQANECLNT